MYKDNVYDITGYKHPSGKSDLLKTVGKDLDIFFQNPKYDFHIDKKSVKNDLSDMYVGELSENCPETTQTPVTTNSTDTTQNPKTSVEPINSSSNTNEISLIFILGVLFVSFL